MKPRLFKDFTPETVLLSNRALIEIFRILRKYSSALVLIGGWVPYLLLQNHRQKGDDFAHVGSIDIDIFVDPTKVKQDEYATIAEMITEAGWRKVPDSIFKFERILQRDDGAPQGITADFLTARDTDLGGRHRHRDIQSDLRGRILDHPELVTEHSAPYSLNGNLPSGGETQLEFNMLDVVGCIGTKGFALADRYKHKDSYDIISVLDHYGTGYKEVTKEFDQFISEESVLDSLGRIKASFRSNKSEGPSLYAEFMQPADHNAYELLAQRAYMLVNEFLRTLGI